MAKSVSITQTTLIKNLLQKTRMMNFNPQRSPYSPDYDLDMTTEQHSRAALENYRSHKGSIIIWRQSRGQIYA